MYFERAAQALGIAADRWSLPDLGRIPSTYDLYLRIDHGDDYEALLPERLRPSAFYAIDTHLPHSWRKIRRAAKHYDVTFCCQRRGAEALPRSEWLPLACDPEWHQAGAESVNWDVAFVGTEGGVPRKFYLQALRERYAKGYIGTADYRQLGAIYGQACIGFNYSIAGDVNMRMFEVMCAGALLMTNATTEPEMRKLGFQDRRHLVFYRTPDELMTGIDHFLASPDERRAIAQAGRELVRSRHTYAQRLRQLLVSVSQRCTLALPETVTGLASCASS